MATRRPEGAHVAGEPLGATEAWRRAVKAAGGRCEGLTAHPGGRRLAWDGRCPERQGVNGGRLYLGTDGVARCGACHDFAESTAKSETTCPDAMPEALF